MSHKTKMKMNQILSDTSSRFRQSDTDSFLHNSRLLFADKTVEEEASNEEQAWLASLSDAELDLLISVKQLAMERAQTLQINPLKGLLGFRVLRAMGLLMKELALEQAKDAGILPKIYESQNDQAEAELTSDVTPTSNDMVQLANDPRKGDTRKRRRMS